LVSLKSTSIFATPNTGKVLNKKSILNGAKNKFYFICRLEKLIITFAPALIQKVFFDKGKKIKSKFFFEKVCGIKKRVYLCIRFRKAGSFRSKKIKIRLHSY